MLRHGATYAGHPTCCAAANAALDIYERDGLIERGRTLEGPLAEALAPLAGHPLVAEVRAGLGALAGIELTEEALAADPSSRRAGSAPAATRGCSCGRSARASRSRRR